MKKLMMMVAVIALASLSQAAYIDWQINKNATKEYNSSTKADASKASAMTVWLIDYSQLKSVESYIQANSSLNTSVDGVLAQGTSSTSAAVSYDKISVSGNAGDTVTFAAVVISGSGADAMYKISKTSGVQLYDPDDATFSSKKTVQTSVLLFNQSTKGWQSVPEPTSAMLMLLGMAGLALRRRRA